MTETSLSFKEIVTLVGAMISFISMIISVVAYYQTIRSNKYRAIHDFLSAMEKEEFVVARKYVYNYSPKGKIKIDKEKISVVINFFQHWGVLTKEGYLPMRIFKTGSGAGVIRMYEKVCEYIAEYRKINNDSTYADNFEWLYYKVKNIYLSKNN